MPRKAESPLEGGTPTKRRRLADDDDDIVSPLRSKTPAAKVIKHTPTVATPTVTGTPASRKSSAKRVADSLVAAQGQAETPTIAPKRRGRPPKNPPTATATPAAPLPSFDDDVFGTPEPIPVKRPRGRPPKNPQAAAVAAAGPSTNGDAVVVTPKKRGRPPKNPQPAAPAADGIAEVVVTPKKRGRPPKNPQVAVSEPKFELGTASPVVTPKKRGRPPKNPLAVVSEPKFELGTASPVVTPKKRGRPPKNPQAVASPAPIPTADNLEVVITPKRRGRPPKSAQLNKPAPLPSFDDEALNAADDAISQEAFLANEARRRAREARNFTFEGDASAPRQTRSGRVVDKKIVDEYGADEVEVDEGRDEDQAAEEDNRGEDMDVDDDIPRPEDDDLVITDAPAQLEREATVDTAASVAPLPSHARPHVLRILSTLTGSEKEPAPFVDEEGNEALQGLVSLLRGTVERGEGNSALVTGPRGVGKSKTVARALRLLPSSSGSAPIIVRLSGHAQTDDRRAIREMGRQIAVAEGKNVDDDEDEDELAGDFAPTTLPSHLLALLTSPSPRAIIVIIDEFDLFTEHARQALLYCLLDVVQSVQTGPVETTPRGLAVVGITSRVDTLLLLEKRVKSRFSHRVWRVNSPLAPNGPGWKPTMRRALVPWESDNADTVAFDNDTRNWMGDWEYAVDTLLGSPKITASLDRLAGLTTDVRQLYRPFIQPITSVLGNKTDYLFVPVLVSSVQSQIELAGWGTGTAGASKLKGLSHPALGVLIVAKHLAYAGRTDFSLAQIEDEYLRFGRTRLVGSGRARWPIDVLRRGSDTCLSLGLLAPAGPANAVPRFAKVRSSLSPHEVVAFFRGEGGNTLGPELVGWGKMSGGHV